MKTTPMTFIEAAYAASNLRYIEQLLGHSVPPGMIDATELGDHLLNSIEASRVASNIRYVMAMKGGEPGPRSQWKLDKFSYYCLVGSIVIPAVIAVIAVIYALIAF